MGMSKVGNQIRPKGNASLRAFLFMPVRQAASRTQTGDITSGRFVIIEQNRT